MRANHLIPTVTQLSPLFPVFAGAVVCALSRGRSTSPDADGISDGTRETQIIRFAALGLTDKEIAERLNLSPNTIYTYWRRVRARYGSNSRGEAISRYLHDSFNHFRQIVDLFPDTILIIQQSRICFASPAAAALFDLTSHEMSLNQPIDRYLETETLPMVEDRNLRFGTDRTVGRPVSVRRPNGSFVPTVFSSTPIEWKGRMASLTVLREVCSKPDPEFMAGDSLPDIILMLDSTGKCLDYRPGPKAPNTNEAVGKVYGDVLEPAIVSAINEARKKLNQVSSEVTVRTDVSEIGRFVTRCSTLADDRTLVLVRFA